MLSREELKKQYPIKTRFAAYLVERGYRMIPGTLNEGPAGVFAQVTQRGSPDPLHFTEVTTINPLKHYVRLSPADYDNDSKTDGKF